VRIQNDALDIAESGKFIGVLPTRRPAPNQYRKRLLDEVVRFVVISGERPVRKEQHCARSERHVGTQGGADVFSRRSRPRTSSRRPRHVGQSLPLALPQLPSLRVLAASGSNNPPNKSAPTPPMPGGPSPLKAMPRKAQASRVKNVNQLCAEISPIKRATDKRACRPAWVQAIASRHYAHAPSGLVRAKEWTTPTPRPPHSACRGHERLAETTSVLLAPRPRIGSATVSREARKLARNSGRAAGFLPRAIKATHRHGVESARHALGQPPR